MVVASTAPGLQDLVEGGEQRLLDRQLLDDGLDDEVAVGQVVEPVDAGDPGQRGVALRLVDLAAQHAFSSDRSSVGGRLATFSSPRPTYRVS